MPAAKADYYALLGVPRDADQETIQRAFHALVRDVHPDVSSSPDDHRRFRQLTEAYGVLSKPASRRLYDTYGYRGRGNEVFDDDDLEDDAEPGERGADVRARIQLEPFEAERGTRKLVRYEAEVVCPTCDGYGTIGEPDPDCPECHGTGEVREVSDLASARILRIDVCDACGIEPCDACDGSGGVMAEKILRVVTPEGAQDGEQLRVTGVGGIGAPDGFPGDLLLEIEVLPEPQDRRLVRYLALAGMLAATAFLVAYILLA